MMIRRLALMVFLAVPARHAGAMDVRVAGNQLIMSGGITGAEIAQMRDVMPSNPQIDTVILKDSRGGDVWTAMRLGEMFQERGFKTAVSGHCMSACVIAFLGGTERSFADGREGRYTFLAIHTPTYASDGLRATKGDPSRSARGDLLYWMGKRIKDAALLERGLSNDDPNGFVYLFDQARSTRKDGVTAFHCKGPEKRKVADCEAIPGNNALQAGFVTSGTIIPVNQ